MNKYLMGIILIIMSAFGWYLWHHKGADFMNAWCGSMIFFGCIICAIIILIFAPNFLPFN